MSELILTADQLDELADVIAEKIAARAAGELISADDLAKRIGSSRDFVYEHAAELGAVRIGDGPRPRLRFRWPQVLDQLAKEPRATAPTVVRQRRTRPKTSVDLLPIRGDR